MLVILLVIIFVILLSEEGKNGKGLFEGEIKMFLYFIEMRENNFKWNIVYWIEIELMMMFFYNVLFNEIVVRDSRF